MRLFISLEFPSKTLLCTMSAQARKAISKPRSMKMSTWLFIEPILPTPLKTNQTRNSCVSYASILMSRIASDRLYLNSEQRSWEKGSAAPNANNVCTLSRNEARAEKPVVHTPRRALAQRCRWAACRVAPRQKPAIIPIGTETREGERNERHPRRGRHRR